VVDAINRWLTHADPQIRSHISETFGTDAAIAIAEGTGDRPTQLKNLYQQQLGKVAQFVRYFEMRDSNDREASVGGTQDTAKTPFRFFPVYTNVAPQF
jgi:hypothetical protein